MKIEIDFWIAIIFPICAILLLLYVDYQRRRSIRDFEIHRRMVEDLIDRKNRKPRFKVGDSVIPVAPKENLYRGRYGTVEKVDEKDLTCLVSFDGLTYPIWVEEYRLQKAERR